MRTVHVYKAMRSGSFSPESVTIVVDTELPDFDYSDPDLLKKASEFYDQQAHSLLQALTDALPGGTIDRLLAKLLEHKASHFRVPSWREG